jgi:hypothetical protein
MARPLMKSDSPAIVSKAHELVQEAEEIASRGQRGIRRLLRRLGMNQKGLETSSGGTPVAATQVPLAGMANESKKKYFFQDEER